MVKPKIGDFKIDRDLYMLELKGPARSLPPPYHTDQHNKDQREEGTDFKLRQAVPRQL